MIKIRSYESLIEENKKLKKQLRIAKRGLKNYSDKKAWTSEYDLDSPSFKPLYYKNKFMEEGYKIAQVILEQIKELDK